MSVMFGKSVYIRLIDEIYLMTNHTEVGPGRTLSICPPTYLLTLVS